MTPEYTTIKQAGLRPADFAAIVGVSRTAVGLWLHGMAQPKGDTLDRVQTALRCLTHHVELGKLPHPDRSREKRTKIITKIKAVVHR